MQNRRQAACIILLLPLLCGVLAAVGVYRAVWPQRPSAEWDSVRLSVPTVAYTASPTRAATPSPTEDLTSTRSTAALETPTPKMPTDMPTAIQKALDRVLLPVVRGDRPPGGTAASPDGTAPPPQLEASRTPTSTPRPTPTPTLVWPPALDHPSRSKLGIHVQWNNSPEIMEFVRRMRPAVIKAIDDLGFLAEVKQVSPTTVTVARLEETANGPSRMEGDPLQAARAYVAANLETYRQNPSVDYWEGWNEPVVRGRVEWFAAFEAERVRVMATHGLRAAVGAFSTGVPEWDEFAFLLPAIEAAQQHEGILTLHEYDAPTLDRSAGAGLPGHPNYPDRGALALRYRWWYEDYLIPRGLVIPLVISEVGVDGLVGGQPGPKGRGWQDFAGFWIAQGLGRDGIDAYLAQLSWYDDELQKDEYVLGCAIFTAGAMSDDWRSYDITGILRHIATFVVAPQA